MAVADIMISYGQRVSNSDQKTVHQQLVILVWFCNLCGLYLTKLLLRLNKKMYVGTLINSKVL